MALRHTFAVFVISAILSGCSGKAANGGAEAKGDGTNVITDAQFAEVKANCHLEGANLSATNRTTTTTDANGVTSTVTYTQEDAPANGKSIIIPEGMSQSAIGEAIPCLKSEFERLGVAEAPLRLPEGMGI